jgi:hypothetical protein
MKFSLTAAQRATIYVIALAVLGLVAGYGMVAADKVPLWEGLLFAIFTMPAPITALRHLTPDAPVEEDQ